MTAVDRSQFYSGGFFLIRSGHPGWEELDAELVPPKLVSLSDHISPRFNVVWTWIPGDQESALNFGVQATKWDELEMYCLEEFEKQIDLGGVFSARQYAQQFVATFIPDRTDLYLVEIGLPKALEESEWREAATEHQTKSSIESQIEQHRPLLPDGTILGFDVVGFEYNNLSCSWICSYIHRDMYKLYGMRPNQYGLLDSFDDAQKVYDWIAEDEMKGTRAEPIPYDFWLLVSHPLQ